MNLHTNLDLTRAVAEKVLEILGCREEYKKLRDIYEEMK